MTTTPGTGTAGTSGPDGATTDERRWAAPTVGPGRLSLRRRRGRRWRRRGMLALLALLTLVVALAGYHTVEARQTLLEGRGELERGITALQRGDAEAALASFATARTHLDETAQRLRRPAPRVVGAVPLAGNSLRTARGVTDAALLLTQAGDELAAAALALPEGVATLAPTDGRIPVAPLVEVTPALEHAQARTAEAAATAAATPSSFLVGQVAAARAELVAETASAERTLTTAATLTRALPAFLGADGPRRYFFGAQNPAENRGTGGFVGAYAILTADDGHLEFSEFVSIIDITTTVLEGVEPPSAEYAARYDRFGGAGYPQNFNMTPDFPSAAVAAARMYAVAKGEQLDGAIVADPFALAALMRITGPVEVDEIGLVTADTVVEQTATRAYEAFEDQERGDRKELLGDVAAEVFARFLADAGRQDPSRAARALIETAGGGHVKLHSTDPQVQQAFAEVGIDGAFPTGTGERAGDLIGVVTSNAAPNKADYWLDTSLRYEVTLHPDGTTTAEATVRLRNEAPTTGYSPTVIGPTTIGLEAGTNLQFVSLFTGDDLLGFARDGQPDFAESETELGWRVYSSFEQLASGQSRSMTYRLGNRRGWTPDEDARGGDYLLTLPRQVSVRPVTVDVVLHLPEGLTAVDRNGATLARDGSTVRFATRGPGVTVLDLEVRPVARSGIEQLREWWNRPLFSPDEPAAVEQGS